MPRTLEGWAKYCHSIHYVSNAPIICLSCARAYAEKQEATLKEQINALAVAIMEYQPGEPSRSEGAVECAIRLLCDLRTENERLKAVAKAAGEPPHTELTTNLRGDRRIVLHGGVEHSVDQPCKLCRALASLQPESVKEEMG